QLILSQLGGFLKRHSGNLHFKGDNVLRAKSRVDLEKMLKAAEKKAGADKGDQCHSDFGDDEKVVRTTMAGRTRAFRAFLQYRGKIGFQCSQSWQDATEDAGSYANR